MIVETLEHLAEGGHESLQGDRNMTTTWSVVVVGPHGAARRGVVVFPLRGSD